MLALPRGGVPVAAEVAKELNAPLDVFVVRKLACPVILNWPWAPSLQVACACSLARSSMRCGFLMK